MVMIVNTWSLMMVLVCFPLVSRCEKDSCSSTQEDRKDYLSDASDLKRDDSIEQDSFVGLMGRRSTGGDMDNEFVGLLGRRSTGADSRPKASRGIYIQKGKLRFQRVG